MAVKWEYRTLFLTADAEAQRDFLKQLHPNWNAPKHAPQAMIPQLNEFGEKGWELVHMEPVAISAMLDVNVGGNDPRGNPVYSDVYFCVFKRPKQD